MQHPNFEQTQPQPLMDVGESLINLSSLLNLRRLLSFTKGQVAFDRNLGVAFARNRAVSLIRQHFRGVAFARHAAVAFARQKINLP